MIYGFSLSLRKFLDDYMPEAKEVILMRDGVTLANRLKPFLTVEYLGGSDNLEAAGRESYEEIYYFQVGIRAKDITERFRLEEKVKTVLRRPDGIVFYDDNAAETSIRFNVDVGEFTPISNDDTSNESEYHRGYFDVSITIYRNTGDSEFTQ